MDDAELKQRLDTLEGYVEQLALTIADLQTLHWEMIAQQMAFASVLRDTLAKSGRDKQMLRQQMQAAYRLAKKIVSEREKLWHESGGARPPLDLPPILPDETDN